MTKALTEFKSAFLQAMFEGCTLKETPVFDITRFPMKDLERFGVEIGNKIFRWPEEKHLKKLNLTKPLKLT